MTPLLYVTKWFCTIDCV